MIHIDRAVWNIAPPHQLKMALTARSNRRRQPARHPVMLSMASGLSVSIHNDARNRNLRLSAVSRVRLSHAQHSLPPSRLVRQEPSSHGLPGDAGMAHGGSRAVS